MLDEINGFGRFTDASSSEPVEATPERPSARSDNFDRIFRWLEPRLVRFMSVRVPTERAAELAGEVLFVLWRKRADVGRSVGDAELAGLAFRVADGLTRNALRGDVRRRRLLTRITAGMPLEVSHEVDVADRIAASDEARHLLGGLTEDDRILVGLAVSGLSSAEMSQVLGVPPGTVRMRISRLRKYLSRYAAATGALEGDDDVE